MADAGDVLRQFARVNKNLLKVADQCDAEVFQTLLTQGSLVASEIRSVAPVDDTSETPGALKESVRLEEGEKKGRRTVLIKAGGALTLKPNSKGKPYDYARGAEFGTKDSQAHPFFFPIWRARKKDVKAAVRKAVKAAVPKVFK